ARESERGRGGPIGPARDPGRRQAARGRAARHRGPPPPGQEGTRESAGHLPEAELLLGPCRGDDDLADRGVGAPIKLSAPVRSLRLRPPPCVSPRCSLPT